MVSGLRRVLACLWLSLAALGWGAPDASSPAIVASFIPACPGLQPNVTVIYTGPGEPVAKPSGSEIRVFIAGAAPKVAYHELGAVRVTARGRQTTFSDLVSAAGRAALRLGGDAIISQTPEPRGGDRGSRSVTARIVAWNEPVRAALPTH